MGIIVDHVHKYFDQFHALKGIDLSVQKGELLALLGPSGCGKTTLLRILAGLEMPNQGRVLFSGADMTNVHVRERGVGFVFQHYALFRHMSVFDNVAFGLSIKPAHLRPSKAQIASKVNELLHLVQLEGMAQRFPSQLSGGQRQRVALARALAIDPKVLLLDEPFGALDAKVRKELRRWLRQLHHDLHITTIFVTHDQEEALEVSDRVVVMNEGRIEQIGSPQEVWEKPTSPFVYSFLGDVNLFQARTDGTDLQLLNGTTIDLSTSKDKKPSTTALDNDILSDDTLKNQPTPTSAALGNAAAYVRPSDIEIKKCSDSNDRNFEDNSRQQAHWEGEIDRILSIGATTRIEVHVQSLNRLVEVHIPSQQWQLQGLKLGDKVDLTLKRARIFVQPSEAPMPDNVIDYVI